MRIETTAADFVSPGSGRHGPTLSSQQRTQQHDGTPEAGTPFAKGIALQKGCIQVLGRESHRATTQIFNLYPQSTQQVNQMSNIQNIWQAMQGHRFFGQQDRRQDLQGFVFGPLRSNVTTEGVTPFNEEGIATVWIHQERNFFLKKGFFLKGFLPERA
jgi:hypothetical protein